jgi:uncharacterized SAM-binding protein YcdF (DUF218 family)
MLEGASIAMLAAAAIVAWAELEHRRASRRGFDAGGPGSARVAPASSEAIVVLGFRNRGARANYLNRWRVRAGIRSQHPDAPSSRLVLCGGPTGSHIPESMLMAAYAREDCTYAGELVAETDSTNTWENIVGAIPLIEDADRIAIVSNSLHAEKARAYLRMLRPDLAARLAPAEDYRFGELLLLKPAMAVIGLRNLRRLRGERR